jgi:hypothetical protein
MEHLKADKIEHIFKNSKDKFTDFLDYFRKIHLPLVRFELDSGGKVFRARHSLPNDIMDSFEDYTYPPPTDSFSRIGKPGDVWFYASQDYDACLAELLPSWEKENGEKLRVTFGFWQIKEPLKVLFVPDLENENPEANQKHVQLNEEAMAFWELICPYFFQTLEENPDVYFLTSALITAMLEKGEESGTAIDGVVYPCVEDKKKTNVAIKPHVIDEGKINFTGASDMLFLQEEEDVGDFAGFSGPFQKRTGILEPDSCRISWQV